MGLRRGEVVALRHEDWSRAHRSMTVTGKGGHRRVLPVPDEVTGALARYLAEFPAHHGPLLRTFDGARPLAPVTLSRAFRELATAAGVKLGAWDGVGPHSLLYGASLLRHGSGLGS